MVRTICLDSDVLIDLLKGKNETKDLLKSVDATFVTTTINAFEVWQGRSTDEEIAEFLGEFFLLDFDALSARIAGDLNKVLKKEGALIDMRDLFIGAICMRNQIGLLTGNKDHFERLKNFGIVLV